MHQNAAHLNTQPLQRLVSGRDLQRWLVFLWSLGCKLHVLDFLGLGFARGPGFFFFKGLAKVGLQKVWLGPWFASPLVPWSLVLWSAGPLVLWSSGLWFLGSCAPCSFVFQFSGPLVPWSFGPVVLWSAGPRVLRSLGGPLVHSRSHPLVCGFFWSLLV